MTDPVTSNTPNGTDGTDDLVATLVGEGRKFKTVTDLARGKVESDSFIEKLTEENKALRALISNADETRRTQETMTELLARVSKGTLAREDGGETKPNGSGQGNQSQPLTSRDVELVYRRMRQQEREDANETQALSKVREAYKDQTDTFLEKRARELDLSVETLRAMARQSPSAFLNLVGENQNNNRNAGAASGPLRGSVNTSAVIEATGDSGVRNKKYYDKIKSEKGVKAFVLDRSLQVQMHKDMQTLGDRWDAA